MNGPALIFVNDDNEIFLDDVHVVLFNSLL